MQWHNRRALADRTLVRFLLMTLVIAASCLNASVDECCDDVNRKPVSSSDDVDRKRLCLPAFGRKAQPV